MKTLQFLETLNKPGTQKEVVLIVINYHSYCFLLVA